MRFFEDGPAIPDSLLVQSDAGNVVFFCGAGVSCYSDAQKQSMPNFEKLTKKVVKRLSPSPNSKAGGWIEKRKNGDNDTNIALVDVFDDLKDPEHFGEEMVNREVADILDSEKMKGRNLTQHRHICQISRTENGHPRVVTTNFDVLFEKAVNDIKMEIHLPPINSDSSSNILPSGITYLHGRVPETTDHLSGQPKDLKTNLILSTSDFGEAYLWDRWAAEFTSSLFSSHTVVFIGYSAGDMPIHYMLSGMKISSGSDQRNLYVFGEGNLEDLNQKWKGRGVQPIPYLNRDALWKTIEAWAERSKNPSEWKRGVLQMAQVDPRTLARHERGQVFHVGRTIDGMKLFSELNPVADPRWVNVFDSSIRRGLPIYGARPEEFDYTPLSEYGLDDDPPYIGKRELEQEASEELRRIRRSMYCVDTSPNGGPPEIQAELEEISQKCNAAWTCGNLDSPVMAWWVARQPSVDKAILDSLSSQLEKSEGLSQKARLMWKLILDGRSEALRLGHSDSWISLCLYAKKNGWTEETFQGFKIATTPVLRATSSYDISRFRPPEESWEAVDMEKVVNLEVKFPPRYTADFEIDSNALPLVVEILQDNLMRASQLRSDVQLLYGGIIESPTCYQNRCVSGEIRYMEFNSEVVMFLDLFERLIKLNPVAAKGIAEKWQYSDRYFFRKLKLFALNHDSLFDIDEVAYWIGQLSEEEYWCENNRRELLFLLKDRWAEFSIQQRQDIVDRLLSPPYSLVDQGEDESGDLARFRSATYGCWLASQKCEIPEKSIKQLNRIVQSVNDWKESYVKDTAMIYGPEYIRGASGRSPQVSWDDVSKEFVEAGSVGKFDSLIGNQIEDALSELTDAKKENLYPLNHWKSLIDKWPDDASKALSRKFLKQLAELPDDVLCELKYNLGTYLKRKHINMVSVSSRLAWSVFDRCIDAWMKALDDPGGPSEDGDILYRSSDRDSKRTYGYAIQKPVGMATMSLMDIVMKGSNGVPNVVKRRLNRMLASESEARHQYISILIQHIAILYSADRKWTVDHLFPLFERGHELEEAALSGLASSVICLELDAFRGLQHRITRIYPRVYEFKWSDFDHGRCTALAVEAGTVYQKELTRRERLELIDGFRNMRDEDRVKSISYLKEIGKDTPDGWAKSVIPFFESIWPKDLPFRNKDIAKAVTKVLAHASDHFGDVFSAAKPFIVPVEGDGHLVFDLAVKGGQDGVISKFPEEVLDLLDILISHETKRPPLLLGKILSFISEAMQSLESDPRYRRLHRLSEKAVSGHRMT